MLCVPRFHFMVRICSNSNIYIVHSHHRFIGECSYTSIPESLSCECTQNLWITMKILSAKRISQMIIAP